MSEQDPIVRERTDILDSVGNTTAATGKGFAIASAALTSLALFAAYVTFTGIDGINIFKAPVLAMLFVGAMVPVVFSALAMNAVGKAAMEMVYEVRRQFKDIPGIMEGTGKPEYDKCVEISTQASLKEMLAPGLLTILFPLIIAFFPMLLGMNNMIIAEMLGGYMAGVTVSGVLWAIFQNNAGGAWDNAKKSFEAGVMINGEMTYKGSDAHKASVTGDTVGDPFKDTSGPSMNILIKLTCLIGLVIAPILGNGEHGISEENEVINIEAKKVELSSRASINIYAQASLSGYIDESKVFEMLTIEKFECQDDIICQKISDKFTFPVSFTANSDKENQENKLSGILTFFEGSKLDVELEYISKRNENGIMFITGKIPVSSVNIDGVENDFILNFKAKK
jgi:K(+)-stimulated pyrophosphate-energized sodium pump